MATRTIKAPNGADITLSSDGLRDEDLAIAEILLEMAAEQGSATVRFSEEEIASRLLKKGFDLRTGRRLN
jgi:hypothetical protein